MLVIVDLFMLEAHTLIVIWDKSVGATASISCPLHLGILHIITQRMSLSMMGRSLLLN